ncbi:DUF1573 domain-containing protein [Labilibacter sediminis]|nr:DUF1573 domain-containing protein [Labilibacter sediminis]
MLKKLGFIIVLCTLLFVWGCNISSKKAENHQQHESVDKTKNAVIKFNKKHHQFGDVKQGETVGCYFTFTNEGEYPLFLFKVKPGCGCTAVNYPKEPVLPKEKGEIEVRFDSKGFSGRQYKVIKVEANIENKIKELVVSANVIN